MKKAESVKEFVERIDAAKKKNPKDLSSDRSVSSKSTSQKAQTSYRLQSYRFYLDKQHDSPQY